MLLVTFLDKFAFEDKYDVLDFFAGAARLAKGARVLGGGLQEEVPVKI